MHEHSGHADNQDIYPGGILTVLASDSFDPPFESQRSGEFIRWHEHA